MPNELTSQNKEAEMQFWSEAVDSEEAGLIWLSKYFENARWEGLLLDAGCGRGGAYSFLKAFDKAEIIGVDISIEMLRIAKSRTQQQYILCDLENLPFRGECFKVVLCMETLHHFPEFRATVKELARTLDMDGQFVLLDHNVTNLSKVSNTIGAFISRYYGNQVRTPNEVCHDVDDFISVFSYNQLKRPVVSFVDNTFTLNEEIKYFLRNSKSTLSFLFLARAVLRRLFLAVSLRNCSNVIITVKKLESTLQHVGKVEVSA